MSSSFDLTHPVAIGSDHAGFAYKTELVKKLNGQKIQVIDMGVYEDKSVDYPDYAHPVAASVEKGEAVFGILICGTGNGVCMTANKHHGIRAALCWNNDIAKLVRLHNNANILCMPSRFVSIELACEMLSTFMVTEFEGGRHANRVEKISI